MKNPTGEGKLTYLYLLLILINLAVIIGCTPRYQPAPGERLVNSCSECYENERCTEAFTGNNVLRYISCTQN